MQEKAARTQAEQRSIALLTEKKDWQATLEARETSVQELQKRVMELEEKEADLTLELKVPIKSLFTFPFSTSLTHD